MESTIDTLKYSKILQKRLKELKVKRETELKKYKADLIKWKNDTCDFVLKNYKTRINNITTKDLEERSRNSYRENQSYGAFFVGAPKCPTYPSDKQIRDIQNLLRHLAITGQKTIHISTADLAKYLGSAEDEDS